jgi:hypothetical protein
MTAVPVAASLPVAFTVEAVVPHAIDTVGRAAQDYEQAAIAANVIEMVSTPEDISAAKQEPSAAPQTEPAPDIPSAHVTKRVSLFDQILTAEREVSRNEPLFKGSDVYDQVVANLHSQWTSFVYSVLPPSGKETAAPEVKPEEEACSEAAPTVDNNRVEAAAPALDTVLTHPGSTTAGPTEPGVGFFTKLARILAPDARLAPKEPIPHGQTAVEQAREAMATAVVMEEMRLKQDAAESRERRAKKDAATEVKLRPQINALAAENRSLWKALTAASVAGKTSTFWGLHVSSRVAPDMAPLVSAAATLRSGVSHRPDAAEELATLKAENAWLLES